MHRALGYALLGLSRLGAGLGVGVIAGYLAMDVMRFLDDGRFAGWGLAFMLIVAPVLWLPSLVMAVTSNRMLRGLTVPAHLGLALVLVATLAGVGAAFQDGLPC